MRKSQNPILILLLFASGSAWAQVACPTANPITVTRTTGSTGTSGSLPWAINCLNNVTTLTTIQFNIPGAGPHIIQPLINGPFPTITKANAIIDGSTDNIVIDGSLGEGQGLNISANSAKIVGLTLRNFAATAAPYPLRLNSGTGHEVSNCQIFDNQVGISIARSAGGVNISNNYIGVDKSGTNLSNSVAGIQFEAYVGAAAAPVSNITTNTIGQNTLGVQIGTARNVVISNNSIFCNRSGGISRASAFTIPTITNATTSQITGTAPAASKVEVYRVDNTGCTGFPCQGKTLLGTVTAGAFGTWSLSISSGLSNNDQVTATMTQSNNTSEFSACKTVVDVCANFLASIKSNNVTCNKGSDGSATVSTSGGLNQGINFVWSTAATTATISNLKAGNYTVTATDGAGCQSVQLVSINEPPAISMRTSVVNVTCNGDKSGQINTVVAGGNSPYTYKWSNGATTANLVNLIAGTYTLTVTDFSNCTNTAQTIITQPTALSINLSATDTLCAGTKTGTALAVVSGGTTPYTYLWSTGATTSSIANLGPANYGLSVTDQARCQKIALFQIFEASPLKIDSALVQIKCAGDSAGEINIKVSGGLAPYRFVWENGATTASRKNIKAGTYKLGISDALGCTETVLFTLKDPAPITAKVVTTDPVCFGLNTGTALVDVSSPGPNTYLWSTGATTASLQTLGTGRYGLTVTNANGCKASFPFSINAPSVGIDVTTKATDINCFGASTGQIQSSTTGGKAPYTYQWSNGATTADLSNLKAGTYRVSVSDQNGCADTATVLITAPTQLQAVISATNASCGNSNGTARVNASGGSGPYSYLWNTGATNSSISNLGPNIYSVTVTDNLACQVNTNIPITQSAALVLAFNGTDIPCNETNTGTATVQVSGGTAPYRYAWSNGATSSALSALPPGDYAVTVTDATGCQGNGSQKVGSAPKLNLQIATTNVSCNGQTTGQATASVTGGTPAYAYRWGNGATTSSISNLAAGSYNLTVTDSKQCTQNQTINITQPTALQANATFNRETSANAQNGSANVSVSGGTAPYSFKWSTGATTSAIPGLGQGQYSVTVQDANGCSLVRTGTVGGESCPSLSVSGISTDLACAGAETGSISLSVLGGTAPYVYSWNNGANTSNLTGLNEGTYAVTVTDAKRCTGNFSSTLKAGSRMPKPLYGIVAPDTVCGNETFTLRADDLFPGPKVSYIWQLPNGQELKSSTTSLKLKATSSDFDGEYTAYRDSAGCKSSIFGPVIVDVVSLPANSFSAGRDTTLCQGNSVALKAKAPTNGKASWLSLSTKVSVLDPNSPNTTVQNLNIGTNRFVWRVALGKCIQAASDTVTVFLEKAPILANDKYTIERAQDVAAMNILLNDNLAGIKDTTVSWTGAPTQGNFEFIPDSKSFRYTAEPDFRGIIQFQYVVCNKASACATPCDTAQVAIEVFNLPKPTDGLVLEDPGPNGSLQIRGLQGFSSVDITITNRWGDKVYRNENYDNNAPWRGHAGDNGPFLPPGAYYYVISAFDDGKLVGKPQTGAIYLFKKENP